MTSTRRVPQFGTDGVRGLANTDLTVELALGIGRAAARVLRETSHEGRWLIGRDTRRSGTMLTAALAAGLASEGVDVIDLGVLPTPGVAFASATHMVPAAVISASHNPFADNGIKLFAPGGRKLDDPTEQRLERQLARELAGFDGESVAEERPSGAAVGTVTFDPTAAGGYESHLTNVLGGRRLDGLRVIVDCANGAASDIAPRVLGDLGADVTVINAEPDGSNINASCGSTYPEDLQATVRKQGADAGLALDGDADRVLTVDGSGALIDGDHLIAMCAIDLHERGELHDDTVVVTVMTNLGFRIGMEAHGIHVVETSVGDRAVFSAMEAGRFSLGGEQSGHVIFRDVASTGDGVLTGLWVLDLMKRSGRPLADLANASMSRLPQVLVNVAVEHPHADVAELIAADIADAATEMRDQGRVLVRPSGTEPLVRVMVEAPTEGQAQAVADRLVTAVRAACSS